MTKATRHWRDFSRATYAQRDMPSELFLGRGMLSRGEVQALFTCGADFFANRGKIVDAGAFAGMSAYSFATGLRHNPIGDFGPEPVIHSYDKFIADDGYTADYLRNVFYTARNTNGEAKEVLWSPGPDEDFLSVFWHQNQSHTDLIEAHQGDFGDQPWPHGDIEILFMDVAKTKALQDHMLREFLPHMIEGESVLIQQDYNHVWHPYIHLAMEILAPCFDILVAGEAASRFYLCRSLPSDDLLAEAIALDLDATQIKEAYSDALAKSDPAFRRMLMLAQVKALKDGGVEDEAQGAADQVVRSFDDKPVADWVSADISRILGE